MLEKYTSQFTVIISSFKEEIATLRTGRAHPGMVENILIETYNSKMPLKQVASISTQDAKSLIIEPWDKSIIKDIEKGIVEAKVGFTPVSEGSLLRIKIPELTEERRLELKKVLNQILEKTRAQIRSRRDEAKREIETQERVKTISLDEKYRLIEKLNETTREFNEQIETLGQNKIKEIMEV